MLFYVPVIKIFVFAFSSRAKIPWKLFKRNVTVVILWQPQNTQNKIKKLPQFRRKLYSTNSAQMSGVVCLSRPLVFARPRVPRPWVLASHVPESHVPESHVPESHVPKSHVLIPHPSPTFSHSQSVQYTCCFVNNTVTYFNLFVCSFKKRDMSVM